MKITDDQILVEYDDDGLRQYVGSNDGTGHFVLTDTVKGSNRAALHQLPGSEVLEGSWIEDGERGMWRIELA